MKTILSGICLFFAVLLLISCLTPYIPVQYAPFLSFLCLTAPLLVLINLFCLLLGVWLRLRAAWVSLGVLLAGYLLLGPFYRLGGTPESEEKGLKVMSYNARGFDRYNFFPNRNVGQGIRALVTEAEPDIVCFQEFDYPQVKNYEDYPYRFFTYQFDDDTHVQQAIFSKYPIVEKGSLQFPDTRNNGLYADILYKEDTLRIYNIHLQSFQVIPSRRMLQSMAQESFYKRITRAFIKQQDQAELVRAHLESSPYPAIVCGDLNNTQFSRVYRMVKGEMADSFREEGQGFGTTYTLRFLPLRIDVILADPVFEVRAHQNFQTRLSDHFPIMATFSFGERDNNNP